MNNGFKLYNNLSINLPKNKNLSIFYSLLMLKYPIHFVTKL